MSNAVPSFLQLGYRPLALPVQAATPAASSGIGTGGAIAIGVGDPDRRLKGLRGPYPSRDEAVAVARTQLGVWYPKVAYSDVPPSP